MDGNVVLYSSALGLACLVAVALAIMAYFRLSVAGATSFLLGNVAIFSYALGSLFEIHSSTSSQVLASLTLEYIGITTIGPLWYLTSLSASGESWKLNFLQRAAMFVVPLVIVTLVATNDFHHLFYADVTLTNHGGFTVPVLQKGPFYLVNMVYMNAFLILGTLTALRTIPRAKGNLRTSMVLLLLSSLFPWAGMLVYQLGLSPWGLDTAPFGFVFSGLCNAVALFRFQLFVVPPLVIEQVFENMKEAVLVLDQRHRLIGFNPAMARIVPGLTPALAGQPVDALTAQLPILERLGTGSDGTCHDLELSVGGSQRVYQLDLSPLRDRQMRVLGEIFMLTDITQRHELQLRLAALARTDELTGLPNRRALLDRLRVAEEHRQRYGAGFAVAMIDVDHFKRINDTWGHDAGDAALVHLARLWTSCLRATDFLGRFGGEEFLLLLIETSETEAVPVLERFRQVTENSPLSWQGTNLALTASFGVTTQRLKAPVSPEELLTRADNALYAAKESGRNCIRMLSPEEPT